MPKIKNYRQKQNLQQYKVLIQDTETNSRFFRLRESRDILHAGKNAFLIAGSEYLIDDTDVLVEILDANGDPIYLHPIENYAEGKARIVSIEVYEDTPPGPAVLTILGEAAYTADGKSVPAEWKGKYNVKFTKILTVDPLRINDTKIRVYSPPTLEVSELLATFRKATPGADTYLSGSGDAVVATAGTVAAPAYPPAFLTPLQGRQVWWNYISDYTTRIYTPNFYLSSSMVGGSWTGSVGIPTTTTDYIVVAGRPSMGKTAFALKLFRWFLEFLWKIV